MQKTNEIRGVMPEFLMIHMAWILPIRIITWYYFWNNWYLFCNFSVNTKNIDLEDNEDQLEVLSLIDDEDNRIFPERNIAMCENILENVEKTSFSIIDAAIKSADTSFVLEPVREEQPRQNKLSRFRTPLNQKKNDDLGKNASNEAGLKLSECELSHASATTSLVPVHKNENAYALALKTMESTQKTQDGTTKITMVQSAVTSFANNMGSFEPELVLSPAKLGQQ